jgi:hypothetical protein
MGRACNTLGRDEKCVYRLILIGKPRGKRPLWSHRLRLEDNISDDS